MTFEAGFGALIRNVFGKKLWEGGSPTRKDCAHVVGSGLHTWPVSEL